MEYDRATGKLDDQDYATLKRELSSEALAALDAENEEKSTARVSEAAEAGDVEAEISRVRAGLSDGTTCPDCGHVNPPGSRFCSICGVGVGPSDLGGPK